MLTISSHVSTVNVFWELSVLTGYNKVAMGIEPSKPLHMDDALLGSRNITEDNNIMIHIYW